MSTTEGRRLVLVVGVGRSGTSLLAGILGQLGMHIPQPEVQADDTNPRGFGEPRWVVDLHHALLRKLKVTVNDSRPAAWELTRGAADDAAVREQLRSWLSGEFSQADAVVVKDPRTVWFLPLWTRCAQELGVPTSFVTMLRHPTEVLKSAVRSYGTWQKDASRAAAWLNVSLETEFATRGAPRAFVRHEDLLADWSAQIRRAGPLLGIDRLADVRAEAHPQADAFVDPTLHRSRVGWDEHDVPEPLRALSDGVWRQLEQLAREGGDTPAVHGELDRRRAAYVELYREAEAIAQSSITAAKPRRKGKQAPPPTLRARLARRLRSRRR